MGRQRPARNDRSEAETVVAPPPVHVRRWTVRPRGAELLEALAARAIRLLRLVWARVEAFAEETAVRFAAKLESLRLRLEVRMLARRRRSAILALGEATYAGDDEAAEQCRGAVEALEAEISRRREHGAAVRAAAADHSRNVRAGARPTEVHEPGTAGRRAPSAG